MKSSHRFSVVLQRSSARMAMIAAATLSLSVPVLAQALSFSIVNSTQAGNPGDILTFRGLFTNNLTTNLYLNSIAFPDGNLTDGTFSLDSSLFFTNVETNLNFDSANNAFFLAGGQTEEFDIFTVGLPTNAVPGTVRSGNVSIQGGGPNDNDELARALATASVLQPVPAPPAWMSLPVGAGIAGLMGVVRRRRKPRGN